MCNFLYTSYYTKTTTNEVIFEHDYFENKQPYWKFCPITPFQIVRFKKFPTYRGCFFFQDDHYQYLQCYVIFKTETCCHITLFQIVRFEKFPHKQGSFSQDNCFEYQHPYIIFKTKHFVPYLHSKLLDLNNSFTNFQDDHWGYQQLHVIFEIEYFVPYLHSKLTDLKNSSQMGGGFIFKRICLSINNSMLSSKLNVCPITLFKVVRIKKKIIHK